MEHTYLTISSGFAISASIAGAALPTTGCGFVITASITGADLWLMFATGPMTFVMFGRLGMGEAQVVMARAMIEIKTERILKKAIGEQDQRLRATSRLSFVTYLYGQVSREGT